MTMNRPARYFTLHMTLLPAPFVGGRLPLTRREAPSHAHEKTRGLRAARYVVPIVECCLAWFGHRSRAMPRYDPVGIGPIQNDRTAHQFSKRVHSAIHVNAAQARTFTLRVCAELLFRHRSEFQERYGAVPFPTRLRRIPIDDYANPSDGHGRLKY